MLPYYNTLVLAPVLSNVHDGHIARTSPSSILIVRDQLKTSLKPFPEEARGAGEVN